MSKRFLLIAWVLWSTLIVSLMFILGTERTTVFWLSFSFTVLSLVVSLVMQFYETGYDRKNRFLNISPIFIISGYMLLASIAGVITATLFVWVDYRIILSVNLVIIVVFGILYAASIGGNDHIDKIESRQKSHHTEL